MNWVSQREQFKEMGQLAYLQIEITNVPRHPLAKLESDPAVFTSYNRPASSLGEVSTCSPGDPASVWPSEPTQSLKSAKVKWMQDL